MKIARLERAVTDLRAVDDAEETPEAVAPL